MTHSSFSNSYIFAEECDNLKANFLKLKYPERLINSTITRFIESQNQEQVRDVQASALVRIILPFKDQRSADTVRRQLSDLGKKINSDLHPVFTSTKIADEIKVAEDKPPLINQQCVVYEFRCDLCDADYVGYTRRRLFPFRKRSLPFLTVDAIIGNQAFCHGRCNICSGLSHNKVTNTFLNSLRKNKV